MRNYILSRPKGTFKDTTLSAFLKRGYITEDDYNQLTTVTTLASETSDSDKQTEKAETNQKESPATKE